jgi:hypothetical protein
VSPNKSAFFPSNQSKPYVFPPPPPPQVVKTQFFQSSQQKSKQVVSEKYLLDNNSIKNLSNRAQSLCLCETVCENIVLS